MQKIRLRAYDPEQKAYYSAFTDAMFEKSPQGIYTATFLNCLGESHSRKGEELIFEQWTGAVDREKTLIFEGDLILMCSSPQSVHEVRWTQSSCSYALWDIEKKTQQMLHAENKERCLVIGNIHDSVKERIQKMLSRLQKERGIQIPDTDGRKQGLSLEAYHAFLGWIYLQTEPVTGKLLSYTPEDKPNTAAMPKKVVGRRIQEQEQAYLDETGLGLGGTSPMPYGER